MKYLSLILSLIVSSCLAADKFSSTSVNSIKTGMESDELKLYVDYDAKKHIAELEHKYISIEKASKMSFDGLSKLERDSKEWEQKALSDGTYCELYIHRANLALAKLLKHSMLPSVQHPAINSWKEWGFTATQFIEVIKECMPNYSDKDWREELKFLANNALEWHHNTELFMKEVKGDEYSSKYHISQHIAINFIYHTKVTLNSSDCAELERCISEDSLGCILNLASKVGNSKHYSMDELQYPLSYQYDGEFADHDKIALMAYVFNEGLRLVCSENGLYDTQLQLKPLGIASDLKIALDSQDSNDIVKAYEQCIIKSAGDRSIQMKCFDALQYFWKLSVCKQNLEVLINKFNGTTCEQYSYLHHIVVEPAFIFLKGKFLLEKYDNEFLEKLKEYGIRSFEDALKEKRTLQHMNRELYQRLLLVEKCQDYLQHKGNFAYIRKDYDAMSRKHKVKSDLVYGPLGEIVSCLRENNKDQLFFFDLSIKKLVFNSPKAREILMRIHSNNTASRILIDFFSSVVSVQSLENSIDNFEFQRQDTPEYRVLNMLHPAFC